MDGTWYAPFSPLILKTRLPDDVLEGLLQVTGALLADDDLSTRYAEQSPVLYDVNRRVELSPELFEGRAELMLHLQDVATGYAREVYRRLDTGEMVSGIDQAHCQAVLTVAWVNSARPGDFVPAHKHSADFSGAVYLKIPEGMGGESGMGGQLTFFDGRPNQLVREKLSFTPSPGDLFVFPGWLSHAVHPYRVPGERRMISFNGIITFPPPDMDGGPDGEG